MRLHVRLNASRVKDEREDGWLEAGREREIDDLYCREVMDSADALTSRMKH